MEQKFLPGMDDIEKYKEIDKETGKKEEADNKVAIFRVQAEKIGKDLHGNDLYEGKITIDFEGKARVLNFHKGRPFSFINTAKPVEITIDGMSAKKIETMPVNLQKIIYNEIEAFEEKDSYPKEIRFADTKRVVAENSSESEMKLEFKSEDELKKFKDFFETL